MFVTTTRPARRGAEGGASPSPLQQDVLDFVASGRGHGVVEATAGSGKTTTLVQVAQLLPQNRPSCFLAFNRATAAELRARLPTHVEATTIHALGRQVVLDSFPHLAQAEPDTEKYRHLALQLLAREDPALGQPAQLAEYLAQLTDFTRLATGAQAPAPAPHEVARRHGLESPATALNTPHLNGLVPQLLRLGLEAVPQGSLDYTDMLYAPLQLGLPWPRYSFVCVDEAQDLSPLTLALVMQLVRAGARALFVGDPKQAIYAFAGADSRSLERIVLTTSATVLPLSVSFRCPTRHVTLARRFSPAMQAAPRAASGSVRVIELGRLPREARPGDLVMCRVNAPLTGLQLRLAEAGTAARVLGEDLVRPTLALAHHLFGARLPLGAVELVARHARAEAERLERELLTSAALGEVLRISQQRHQALGLLLRRLPRGAVSMRQLEILAHHLLGGDAAEAPTPRQGPPEAGAQRQQPSGAGQGPVILSTVHKAKGREARRVFLLFPEELAPAAGSAAEEQDPEAAGATRALEAEAEANVLFVALTRAKHELVLVERTQGALAARLREGQRTLARPGSDQELSNRWLQVLRLASLMARRHPQRRWWALSSAHDTAW